MFGVSELCPAISFARSAVEVKVRITERELLDARAAVPNGRPIASRIAIVYVCKGTRLRGAAGNGGLR